MGVPVAFTEAAMHGLGPTGHIAGQAMHRISNNLLAMEFPPVETMCELSVRGLIDLVQLHDGGRNQGARLDPSGESGEELRLSTNIWNAVWENSKEIPAVVELFEISNRQLLLDPYVEAELGRRGYYDPAVRKAMANLRYDIPSPAELVRFSVRHLWEPDLIGKLGLNEEFPGAVIDYWHAAKGLDYPLFTGPFQEYLEKMLGVEGGSYELLNNYEDAGLPEPTWARAYWWTHWIWPSVGQGAEALFRLDPERDRSFDPPQAVGLNFTEKDFETLMRANDYPPYYRKILAATFYRMPGIRFIRSFYATGVYNEEDLLEWGRRWGYSPRDREDIANNIIATVEGQTKKAQSCASCKVCTSAYEVGILTQANYRECLIGYGVKPEDADRQIGTEDLALRVRRAKEVLANVRKRFLRGTIGANDVRNLLGPYGFDPIRVAEYLTDWGLEFEAGRREVSAQAAVRYACEGLITAEQLVQRLTNLKYSQDDIEVLYLKALSCQAQLAQTNTDKVNRKIWQDKQRAYSACRRQRQVVLEMQRALAAQGSPKDLQKWFCEGSISECDVFSRLNRLGWDDLDITRFLSDCKSGRKPTGVCPPGKAVVPDECPVPQP